MQGIEATTTCAAEEDAMNAAPMCDHAPRSEEMLQANASKSGQALRLLASTCGQCTDNSPHLLLLRVQARG